MFIEVDRLALGLPYMILHKKKWQTIINSYYSYAVTLSVAYDVCCWVCIEKIFLALSERAFSTVNISRQQVWNGLNLDHIWHLLAQKCQMLLPKPRLVCLEPWERRISATWPLWPNSQPQVQQLGHYGTTCSPDLNLIRSGGTAELQWVTCTLMTPSRFWEAEVIDIFEVNQRKCFFCQR